MTLFERWAGAVTIPQLPIERLKVGRNTIIHAPAVSFITNTKLYDLQETGYWLLKTDAPWPFDELYVRHKKAKRRAMARAALVPHNLSSPSQWGKNEEFIWDDAEPLLNEIRSPEKVAEGWHGQFRFQKTDRDSGDPGLRPPQIGALHAIAGYFAVGRNHDPATVVLPTGTGKTETMIAAQVLLQIRRLLVLVPSDALRKQVSQKFETLGLLRELNCVPAHTRSPRVARLISGVQSMEDARAIITNSNVIVALPETLDASDPTLAQYLCQESDALFVDEAHHLAAQTWTRVRDRFAGKKVVQYTATPFRNDRKHIGGNIIFNYKLSDAQEDQYYRRIRLHTVEEYGDEDARDRAIAEQAVLILRNDRRKYDHLLMARTRSKAKAEELLPLYRKLAPEFHPVVVYSGSGRRHRNDISLKSLRDKSKNGSRIVICVDMLGEGFDLPQLKVAAIHDNHKSLSVTLQFVGRFTRSAENVGDAAVVTNIADPEAEKRLEELYAEGADWDHLISRMSDTRVGEELHLQEIVEKLKAGGDLHDQISLWNLSPALSTQIYRTSCKEWSPRRFREIFPKDANLWHAVSRDPQVLVIVARQQFEVQWGNFDNLREVTYDLLIAYWSQQENALFVHASDYDRMRVAQVAREITSGEIALLSGPQVFNVLNNVQLPLAKSLGSSRFGAISFTSYFGPNVTEGLASIEKSESELNYIACLGYENGEKVLWGAAQRKAKIWQRKSGSLDDWIAWCNGTYKKLMDDSGHSDNITRDFLRPKKLNSLYREHPIAVQWGEYLQSSFSDNLAVLFGRHAVALHFAEAEIIVATNEVVQIAIFSDDFRSVYAFRIDSSSPRGYVYDLIEGLAELEQYFSQFLT